VHNVPTDFCSPNEPPPTLHVGHWLVYPQQPQRDGYLASHVTRRTGCGGMATPWTLAARPGQKLKLVLYDFASTMPTTATTMTDDGSLIFQQEVRGSG
jgi:hypothetical protein